MTGPPPRPVAVVHTLPDLAVGGGQILLLRTLAAMPSDTTHVVFALADGPMRAAYAAAGIEIVVASDRRRAAFELASLVRRRRLDLVHTNHTAVDRTVGQLAALRARVPVVNTFHGVAPERSRRDLARAVNRALVHTNIAHFVAVSAAVGASYRAALHLDNDRLTVVPPGLPPDAFVPPGPDAVDALRGDLGIPEGTHVVVVVARLVEGKGHRLVLDTVARLASELPLRLLLAGDGPERASLESYARALGIADSVTFLGRRDDVAVLLAAADVVVSGSEAEGFPLNVLEAMAQRRPIVAARLPAFDDVLVDGENASLVAHDATALAAAVRRLLVEPDRATALGVAAGGTAQQYTAARTAQALVAVYRSVLDRRGAPETAVTDRMSGIHDDFSAPVRRGEVLGTVSRSGHRRDGADAEWLISIDDGGARLAPLAHPGWGRAGLAYGPIELRPGTAFVVHVLNGHNAAQEHPARNRVKLLGRWAIGSGTDPAQQRLIPLLRHSSRETLLHRLRRFWSLDRRHAGDDLDTTNLTIGWFGEAVPVRPLDRLGVIVVSGSPEDSGVLSVVGPSGPVVVRDRLGEMPMRIAGVVGSDSIALFAAIGVEVDSPVSYRPIGRVALLPGPTAWLGIHQRIMGEIGFSPDTRVHEVVSDSVPAWSSWWTTAVVADRFGGSTVAPLDGAPAPTGQRWRRLDDALVIDAGEPLGLISAGVRLGEHSASVSLDWRAVPSGASYVRLRLAMGEGTVERLDESRSEVLAVFPVPVVVDRELDVMVIDAGDSVRVVVDGLLVWSDRVGFPAAAATNLRISPPAGGSGITRIEGHPSSLALPPSLDVAPQRLASGSVLAWAESFDGDGDGDGDGADLDGRVGVAGRWERTIGNDRFAVADGVVRVDADRDRPSGGRTLYTVPWGDPDFVDLSVTVRPPGVARGEGHSGRGGLVLWQDHSTYLVINTWLDDGFAGSSVSVFPHLGGFEDVLDAVWVNVGDRIRWGRPYELRVICDGSALALLVGGVPVLYRRLADIDPRHPTMKVHRVGLATNWEWGVDTGTEFSALTARRR